MSVKVESENLTGGHLTDQGKDSYGLPVQDSTPRAIQTRQQFETPRGKNNGIRVPILRDLDRHYIGRKKPTSCRFDIVEKVTTVIKPGSYGVTNNDDGTMEVKSPKTQESSSIKRISVSRQPTFHSTYSSDQKDTSVLEKIGPYHWNTWIKSSKESDARDVLYRNTYCQTPEQVRYRTLTLPRISNAPNADRPWTVAGDDKPIISKYDHGEYNKVVTIVPQQPRGTVVRFREYMKPTTYASDGKPLAVKRVNRVKSYQNEFATVSSGFPLIRHDIRKLPSKSERPMKFENSRYVRKNKETLFSKQVLPAYKTAFDRDYSSADTFKEYLDSLQQTAKANTPGMHTKDCYGYQNSEMRRSINYHNDVLKSVSDVNQPDTNLDDFTENPHEISVDIKKQEKPETGNKTEFQTLDHVDGLKRPVIDNLSSVHGSVVRAHSDTHSVTMPFSSSVVDGKSVVKIPGIVAETDNVQVNIDEQNIHRENSNMSESKLGNEAKEGSLCPANSPNPELEI